MPTAKLLALWGSPSDRKFKTPPTDVYCRIIRRQAIHTQQFFSTLSESAHLQIPLQPDWSELTTINKSSHLYSDELFPPGLTVLHAPFQSGVILLAEFLVVLGITKTT